MATAQPKIVSQAEWLTARKAHLLKEKELTRLRDTVSAERRRLPMVKVEKDYAFEGPRGKVKLSDLFEGRRQLIVYHFMFDPNDPPAGQEAPFTEGCPGCSYMADNFPNVAHLHARDTTLVLVSRAPLEKIEPFNARMGWTFPWYSSFGSDFNYDFHVTMDESVAPIEYNYTTKAELKSKGETYALSGEQPGLSVFLRGDDGAIYHTYSTYARGLDPLIVSGQMLDLTPYGRQEKWEDSPAGWPQTPTFGWLRHHDKYEGVKSVRQCCQNRDHDG